MAGLSSLYITNKLAAENVDTKTQELILQFLNDAPNAAAIAGVEPAEGPIVDDPLEGYGNQISDYDIGHDVAKRIINKRNSLGGFTHLNQLSGISYFGADKFNDLLYSFKQTIYQVTAIKFNYHTGSITNDALNIRKNYSTTAPSPSWFKGVSSTYIDSPAAYTIKETQGNTLAIRVSLKANGLSAAYVRALGGGRLGRVKETLVSFDSNGNSGYETFELENTTFHGYGVNRYNIAWRWQWRKNSSQPWRDIVVTRHRIFIILQQPTMPWVQSTSSTSLPWTDALELACGWASGATDKDNAAALVTERYNGSGKVSYDTSVGATFYGISTYNLTEMLERLNGGPGLGEKVNCSDSANTVSTLANLLGCDLWQCVMASGFYMNPIQAIGYTVWEPPFWGGFGWHEVAWKGACTENDRLFDGCLKVDGDADPTSAPHTPLLPTNMLFGDCTTMNYRLRLCTSDANGCPNCQPQPSTRQRRPII